MNEEIIRLPAQRPGDSAAVPASAAPAMREAVEIFTSESPSKDVSPVLTRELAIPTLVTNAGRAAQYAWEEYFAGRIRNRHTRAAYLFAVRKFLAWCEERNVTLTAVSPGMIGLYLDQHPGSPPTKKLHLSAIRGFFDTLVLRHALILNPALSTKTERYSASEGKTPEITVEQARRLLQSIELEKKNLDRHELGNMELAPVKKASVVDWRDKAILAILVYTAARVGAVAKLRVGDFVNEGAQFSLRFREKRGKHRSIPARHDLQELLGEYLERAATQHTTKETPLFRTVQGKSGRLTVKSMTPGDIGRMVKRRLAAAGLPSNISPHSFRSCTATDLLLQGIPLDAVQNLLGHADARVTRLYDRRPRRVTRNVVERISV